MTAAKPTLAVVLGSIRDGRFCDTVANWTAAEIARQDRFAVDMIDPRQFDQACWQGDRKSAAAVTLRQRLDRAEGFVVVTPEYNHGYPAALKALIDLTGAEWQAKPIAFVSYGGISGGLRAVEQLRPVFAELHAVTLRDTVSFAGARSRFDDSGNAKDPEGPRQAMATLLARLSWWMDALSNARRSRPYSEVVA
jgi:NAD(P)H-dependent FMN reductase